VCSPRNSFGERKTCRPKGSLTGIRGVYLVAAELAKRDYIASPTSRSAAGADLLVTDASMQRAFSVQVKTNGKAMNFWLVGTPYVPMLQEHNVRTGFFERGQFESVRAHLREPLRGVITFAYLTGWRVPSEVLTLEWRQVDRQAGTVRLDPGTTKNKEGRLFPYADLLPELASVIEAQWLEREALKKKGVIVLHVFHRHGKRIADFRHAWETACKAAGCPGRIPHDLRRTSVRNLVRAGVPERVAMQLTGHKTRSVFDRCDIVNEADLAEAVRKLGVSVATSATGARG